MRLALLTLALTVLPPAAHAAPRTIDLDPVQVPSAPAPSRARGAPTPTGIEGGASKAQARTDSFDARIKRAGERATRMMCEGCFSTRAVRARPEDDLAPFDPAEAPPIE